MLENRPATSVSEAVVSRRSVRAFLDQPVAQATVRRILQSSARAPSGTNMQPWRVYVLTGESRDALCDTVCAAFDDPSRQYDGEVRYYPRSWFEPYVSRRRKVGWDLYGLLGITREDRQSMHVQHRRNFRFFDAPVGMIFTIHRELETGSWLDYGMFLQNIMLLAREAGLHTCPQAAWADYHMPIRETLGLSADEVVVCGMALGYADIDAVENTLETERMDLAEFVRFGE